MFGEGRGSGSQNKVMIQEGVFDRIEDEDDEDVEINEASKT